jgi:ADP-ribose pyrophosphatase YjhB (NUDIX family)
VKLIKEIKDKDIFDVPVFKDSTYPRHRETSRGVVLKNNEVAILYLPDLKLYKLPGGEILNGESTKNAFSRNVLEETGFTCDNIRELGKIIEYKNKYGQIQHSYCFIANAKIQKDTITRKIENDQDKFRIMWVTIDDAIALLKESSPLEYTPKFIRVRDMSILFLAKDILD